jgi:glycosyltransferase involved in cell wall biosynthesis
MRKILYVGNKLSKHGNTATSIETLGAFLEKENYALIYASDKKSKSLRLIDMVITTIKNRKCVFVVLIDVYSTTNFWYALLISQLCRFLKLPYIAKLHGGNLPYRLENNPKFCDLIFNFSKYNVAPSMYLFHLFEKKYPRNTEYIANTFDLSIYKFLTREKVEPKILWVRSLSKIYNPEMAIRSIFLLKDKYPDIYLTMVGPDKENLLENCKKLASTLEVKVIFNGKLENKDWISLSSNYSVFINTSNFDNTPVSLIEAMALGLPLVTTDVGGIPYLVTNNQTALLVKENNVVEMATAIDSLLSDKSLRLKLTKNAREKVESFDWEIVKNKWQVILQSIQ